ncbi:MAG: LUD domain-containing protein [Planctomycetes bacterium]|nr:LUD domain-containing protein [Planctomycetota bacterium]
MSVRSRMLADIAARLGRKVSASAPPPPPLPAMPGIAGNMLATTFEQKLVAIGGHVHHATAATVGAVVAGLLQQFAAGRIFASDADSVRALAAATPDRHWHGPDDPRTELLATDVGVTSAWLGIAETGTLVLRSDLERSRQASLVPPVHVALLDSRRLVGTLGAALQQLPRPLPPAVTFVTGPSRTADIELQLVVGVHGPKALHVVLLDG